MAIWLGAITLIVALGTGATYAALSNTSDHPARTLHGAPGSSTTFRARTGAPRDVIAKIVTANPPRPLNHDAPLKLWVGGDSLAGELGPSLGNELAPSGIVKTTVDFKVGSGLHDHGLRNWPQRVPEQMGQYDPDVAIFMIGANDASIVSTNNASWEPQYRARIAEIMTELSGSGKRTVYWVGPPTMQSSNLNRGTRALSALMADEARNYKNLIFVDAFALFDDANGDYTNHLDLPALQRTHVLVRIADGVHFTNDGADWLAYNVGLLLDEQWQITKQSGGAPLTVTLERGGGSVPGYRPGYSPNGYATSSSSGTSTSTFVSSSTINGATTTANNGPSTSVSGPSTSQGAGSSTTHGSPTTAAHASTSAPTTTT